LKRSPAGIAKQLNDFATRYAQAWCSQNPDSVAAFFAQNGSLSVNDGRPAIGRGAIADVARGFMRDFPDLVVTFDNLQDSAADGHAVFHWTLIGTNTGPGGSGKPVRISGYERWTFNNDGLLLRSKGQFDAASYQRQLNGGDR
jgi:hypothetical protein